LLAGVPVLIKDNYDVAGVPASLGIAGRRRVADADAVVVSRLRRAGAVVIGKTAMDTLAWSMTGQAPGFPVCENPAAPGCVPGGSSGGSAAAVAARIVPLALGSDTAGSTRLPGAWCGVVGMKLSRGAVPLAGCAPLAPTLDCAGILSRSIRDSRLALRALGAADGEARAAGALRVGVAPGSERLRAQIREAGHFVVDVQDSWRAPGIGTICAVELAAAWADELASELDRLDESIRAAVEAGANTPAGEYARALEACSEEELRARSVFDAADVLALPTSDLVAPPLDEPASVAEASRNTRAFNVYGWPAISIPWGTSDDKPVGLQLVAAPGRDAWLLGCADELARGRPFLDQKST
jgi:aspartyl-tRNA(Asn)/glutamyl-tRNA(Gln) amidotransferase subunit A